jgi:hypothetical protein
MDKVLGGDTKSSLVIAQPAPEALFGGQSPGGLNDSLDLFG